MIGARTGFPLRLLLLALFVAATAGVFLVLLNIAGGVQVGDRYRVDAVVPTAVQLSTNADVTSAGVRIGRVEEVSNRGATAVLRLAIDPDHGPVHRDARVQVRAKTLVGENYVDLDPGTARAGAVPDGGELPVRRAVATTQLEDVLSQMSPQRRRRLSRLLQGLGPGVGDARITGRALSGVADLMEGGKALVAPLDAERDALRALVADLGTVFRAVGERGEMLRTLVTAGRTASRSVAAEDRALRASLRELAPTLTAARRTTGRLAGVGSRAVPLLDDLTPAVQRLTPLARDLPEVSRTTLGALRELQRAAPVTRRVLAALRAVGAPGAAAVPALNEVLRDLGPVIRYLSPYSRDAGSFFAGLGQSVSSRDATGHVARLQPVLSMAALPVLGETERRAIDAALGAGLGRLLNVRGHNNLPRPDTLGAPQPRSGDAPRVERDGTP
ncbi:MAG TPA: MlaD family protein [Baekduia sp.]|nr:MlaD family protein [Baekduia sp.]